MTGNLKEVTFFLRNSHHTEWVIRKSRSGVNWQGEFKAQGVKQGHKIYMLLRSVTWTLTQTAQRKLNRFERKILRRIYGLTQEGGHWRPRRNSELYSLYSEPNIVEDIKIRILG